jgi:hypothetical protein
MASREKTSAIAEAASLIRASRYLNLKMLITQNIDSVQ